MSFPRRVINGKGPATVLGGAQVSRPVIDAMTEVMGASVHMAELQAAAGAEIAASVGAEAAFVTGCAAAGMSIGIAAAIGGADMGQVTTLPSPSHDRNEIVIQKSHVIIVGGCDANQVIRLGGGHPVEVGTAADCADFHLATGLSERTAAALFIDGERAHGSGALGLRAFADQCHTAGVPVIVDAAGTHDPAQFFAEGADLVVFSVHKWFRGPTAGVIAGREELVHAAFLHAEFGIGRPMKAGKEGVAGAREAVRLWRTQDHRTRQELERELVTSIVAGLQNLPGLQVHATRTLHESTAEQSVHIGVNSEAAGLQAWQLAAATEACDPSVVLYDYEAAQRYLLIDPGFLEPGDDAEIIRVIRQVLEQAHESPRELQTTPPPRYKTLTETMAAWRTSFVQ